MANLVRVGLTGKAPEEPIVFSSVGIHSYTIPKKGIYQLEVWGASGGSTGYRSYIGGGAGGYAKGNVQLERGQILYVCVGGAGSWQNGGYNGGGGSLNYGESCEEGGTTVAGGGGATHIGKTNSILRNTAQSNLYIVAGGGGGGKGFNHFGQVTGYSGGTGGGERGGDSGQTGWGGYPGNGVYGYGLDYGGGSGLGGGCNGGASSANGASGGCGYTGGCISGTTSMQNGVQSGNGYARITYIGR